MKNMLLGLLLAAAMPLNGQCALGAGAAASAMDGVAMTVHESVSAAGTRVREYVAGGTVCAVSWQGPVQPDLRHLLGRYFERYLAGARAGMSGHGHVSLRSGDLVVESHGHLRAFSGKAYLPQLLPPGVGADQIE